MSPVSSLFPLANLTLVHSYFAVTVTVPCAANFQELGLNVGLMKDKKKIKRQSEGQVDDGFQEVA